MHSCIICGSQVCTAVVLAVVKPPADGIKKPTRRYRDRMVTILSVSLENHPGSLSDVLAVLGSNSINIHAVEAQAMGDFGGVRLQVADPKKAGKLLREQGFDVVEADAIELMLPNQAGVLADVARKLAAAKINIVSLWGTTPVAGSGQGRIMLRVNDADAARKLLNLRDTAPAPPRPAKKSSN